MVVVRHDWPSLVEVSAGVWGCCLYHSTHRWGSEIRGPCLHVWGVRVRKRNIVSTWTQKSLLQMHRHGWRGWDNGSMLFPRPAYRLPLLMHGFRSHIWKIPAYLLDLTRSTFLARHGGVLRFRETLHRFIMSQNISEHDWNALLVVSGHPTKANFNIN